MTTLYKEVSIGAPREFVWDAMKDVGALHTRLVRGFVVDTRLEADARIVTFRNGLVVREPIISIDDRRYRLAWAAEGGPATHYNAVVELVAEPSGCRVVWTTDLLPDEIEEAVAAMQDEAVLAMKCTIEDAVLAANPYASDAVYAARLA